MEATLTLTSKYAREGSRNITANNPKLPTSFLTCMEGPPYDGLRCELHLYMSVDCDLTFEALSILPGDREDVGGKNVQMGVSRLMGKEYLPVWEGKYISLEVSRAFSFFCNHDFMALRLGNRNRTDPLRDHLLDRDIERMLTYVSIQRKSSAASAVENLGHRI